MFLKALITILVIAAIGCGAAPEIDIDVLVFTRAEEYVHESVVDGVAMLEVMAESEGWEVETVNDPAVFSAERLASVDVVVWLSTSGDVLDAGQEGAFESFVRNGGGWVGIHGASNTEFEWPFYGELLGGGAWFAEHPEIQSAELVLENPEHPAMEGFSDDLRWTDEWYTFRTNPRPVVTVLMTVDESSYDPGEGAMGTDHPVVWCHRVDGGRAFYTALGHRSEAYADPRFIEHIRAAIEWAAGRQSTEIR